MATFNQEGQTIHGDQYNAGGDMDFKQGDTTINSGDTYSGDFRGAILNVRSTLSNVTQSIGAIPYASTADKQTLEDLIKQLTAVLEAAIQQNPTAAEETEAVAETAKALVDQAKQDKPNRSLLKITGEGLVKATENLAQLTPPVLDISKKIVTFILGMVAAAG